MSKHFAHEEDLLTEHLYRDWFIHSIFGWVVRVRGRVRVRVRVRVWVWVWVRVG